MHQKDVFCLTRQIVKEWKRGIHEQPRMRGEMRGRRRNKKWSFKKKKKIERRVLFKQAEIL